MCRVTRSDFASWQALPESAPGSTLLPARSRQSPLEGDPPHSAAVGCGVDVAARTSPANDREARALVPQKGSV